MPRVVFVDHIAQPSGAEIALVRLVKALGSATQAIALLGEHGPLEGELQATGATVSVLPMADALRSTRKSSITPGHASVRLLRMFARHTWAVRRQLLVMRPDIVHTNSLKAAVYGGLAGRLAGIPVVWHIRDRIADDYLPKPAVWMIRLLARVLPTEIVANSVTTLSTLPLSSKVNLVHNAVVPDVIPEASSRASRTTIEPLVVGMVGRIAPWKGQDVFLRAFAQAFPRGPEQARIIGSAMFGEDNYERELRQLAISLGIDERVEWRGFCDDIETELNDVSVLVHASVTAEPFGQVVVEGMAAGLPVVATSAGGPVEIIDDGRDGVLTPPGDVDALAGALTTLRDDPELRDRLGAAARTAAARYNPQVTAEAMLTVYERVLTRKRWFKRPWR